MCAIQFYVPVCLSHDWKHTPFDLLSWSENSAGFSLMCNMGKQNAIWLAKQN